MARDWAAIGLAWLAEDVQKQHGDHATDRVKVATAQLPVVEDIDKLATAGVDILAWLNASNSMRVRAQAIARSHPKLDVEAMREAVFSALKGVRNVGQRTVEIVKRPLPTGEMYTGIDETEFRQLYAAALVDQGVDEQVALSIARQVGF